LNVDPFLLNNINLKWFIIVSNELKRGMFKFKPIYRVYISKLNKKSTKSLIIDSFREKIVQQAIYIILNAIYESSFLNSSHDFYFNESTYKVLKEVKHKFQDVK